MRKRRGITSEALFRYAEGYHKRHEAYPTVRTCSQRFGCRLVEVMEAVEDYHGPGYMGLVVAFGIPGVGATDTFPLAKQLVEAYGP